VNIGIIIIDDKNEKRENESKRSLFFYKAIYSLVKYILTSECDITLLHSVAIYLAMLGAI